MKKENTCASANNAKAYLKCSLASSLHQVREMLPNGEKWTTFPDCPNHPKLTTEWKTVTESDGVINLSEVSTKKPKPAAYNGSNAREMSYTHDTLRHCLSV